MGRNIGSRAVHSFRLALGIVELNVICLAYYAEANISTLVAGYCKCNHRGLWGEILEESAAVKDDIKASVPFGPVYTNVEQQ